MIKEVLGKIWSSGKKEEKSVEPTRKEPVSHQAYWDRRRDLRARLRGRYPGG